MSKSWREKYENDNDLFTVVNLLSINLEKSNLDDWWHADKKLSKQEKEILQEYMPNHKLNKDNTKFLYKKLSKLLHYKISDEKMKGVKLPYLIPLDKILYVIQNIYEPKKVLLHLIKNRM